MFPDSLDPVLFGVISAAVEEESVAAYEAGFTDGLRSAAYLLPDDVDDLSPPDDLGPPGDMAMVGDDGGCAAPPRPQ